MLKKYLASIGLIVFFLFTPLKSPATDRPDSQTAEDKDYSATELEDPFFDPFEGNGKTPSPVSISDPFEKYNRTMFVFNDKVYAYVLDPVAKGYSFFVPEAARKSVRRFFINLYTPTRFLNCLLQGKMKGAGIEISRLVVNSSIGIGGLFDPAKNYFDLTRYDEDTGQTFGFYGIGTGPYIVLPFLGSSSVRGTVGLVIDMLPLDPLFYAKIKLWESAAIRTYEIVNDSSLRIGEYESLKKAAIDPYISVRDLYFQYVESAIKK